MTGRSIERHRALCTSLACTMVVFLVSCGGEGTSGSVTAPPVALPPSAPTPAPPPTPSPEPAEMPTCTTMIASPQSQSPFADANFRATLENTQRLQFPVSGNACLSNADLRAAMIIPGNFQRTGAGRMQFTFANGVVDADSGVTTREELRGYSFDADSVAKIWDGTFVIGNPDGRAENFTIGQVFSETEGKPILRIEYITERAGVANHLWAIYRTGTGDGQSFYQDLGIAPDANRPGQIRITYNADGGISLFSGNADETFTFTDNFAF